MARQHKDTPGADPRPEAPGTNVPDTFLKPTVPPEWPEGLDPSESPVVAESPRRALDAARFGNPRKEALHAQPPNSDSVTDDLPMEPDEEQLIRDAEVEPDATDPGVSQEIARGRTGSRRK